MIKLSNIRFHYPSRDRVHRIDVRVPRAKLTMLLGENGSGKSTFLKILLGALKPTSGRISVDSKDITDISHAERATLMAYLPQSHHAIFNYRVHEVIMMGCSHQLNPFEQPRDEHRVRMATIAKQLNIDTLLAHGYREISGGERQLVLLARAMMQQSPILVMDEPTANLDLAHRHQFFARCQQLTADGYTVVMSTHHPDYALEYSDYIVAIKHGQVIASGATAATLSDQLLTDLYDIPLAIKRVDQHYIIVKKENA